MPSVNPFLSSQINDEHRRDLLREASAERMAHDLLTARVSEQSHTHMRGSLVSVDMLLLQAGLTLAKRERVAFCGDEAL